MFTSKAINQPGVLKMNNVNTFLTKLGTDKILLALFGGVIVSGSALVGLAVVAVVWYF